MLAELKQAVASRVSVCNDKISVITAIIGSSNMAEHLQKIGTALQKLDVRIPEHLHPSTSIPSFRRSLSPVCPLIPSIHFYMACTNVILAS